MRYSTLGEHYLETSLILDIAHQQLLTHIPAPRLTRCSCSVLPMHGKPSQLYSIHVIVQPRLGETLDITVLIVDGPVYFPMITRWPITRRVVVVYLLAG